jgi:hypothetical protein
MQLLHDVPGGFYFRDTRRYRSRAQARPPTIRPARGFRGILRVFQLLIDAAAPARKAARVRRVADDRVKPDRLVARDRTRYRSGSFDPRRLRVRFAAVGAAGRISHVAKLPAHPA